MVWPLTKQQTIYAGVAAVLVALFIVKRRKEPSGTVDIEAPTVSGEGAGKFGGTGFEAGYGVPHVETDSEKMQRLIDESNRAIAEDDARLANSNGYLW